MSFLGMIPGPLVYGQIFDSACTQWGSFSMTCSNSHSMGHCSFYNSATLRNYMIAATVGSLVIGEACLFFAIEFYKRAHTGPGKKGFISPRPGMYNEPLYIKAVFREKFKLRGEFIKKFMSNYCIYKTENSTRDCYNESSIAP